MKREIDYAAEVGRMIPSEAGCYDCEWETKGVDSRQDAAAHRQANPTHFTWVNSKPPGT